MKWAILLSMGCTLWPDKGNEMENVSEQRPITADLDWLVVDDGRIRSAHRLPTTARSAAKQYGCGAAVLVQPGHGIHVYIGQRVRNDNGMACPA